LFKPLPQLPKDLKLPEEFVTKKRQIKEVLDEGKPVESSSLSN